MSTADNSNVNSSAKQSSTRSIQPLAVVFSISCPSLRLIIMGTGPSAVPSFEFLLNSQHQVLALITRPERTTHHREKPTNPMREIALRRGIVVFEPESINSPQAHAWLCDRAADLFVVCDYGQILSQETLALARMGGINLHASLLPKFRGAAPINWAIYHGEAETGVTVIHMTPQLDAGPTLVQFRTPIGPAETAPELESRLATLGVGAIHQSIELLAGGAPTPGIVQDPRSVTKAPRLKKEDGLVDWSRSAVAIYNQVRALQPWPKTYTFWKRPNSEPLRLILEIVQPLDDVAQVSIGPPTSTPGTIQQALSNQLIVACGKGSLRIDRLQPAGKRIMTASEFLRGHALLPGEKLG